MSSRIALLPPLLIDQIAAGEVIERPASVVRELLDNALDSGAQRIRVHISGGGLREIRVVDDGCGMSEADLRRCLLRFATSKLRDFDDLGRLATLGFRGEALAAIASVAHVTITSRPADLPAAPEASPAARPMAADVGHRLTSVPGQPIAVGSAGAPQGTTVVVARLFENVPARKKFLKTATTELGHISDVVLRAALAHPAVALELRVDDRVILAADAVAAGQASPDGELPRLSQLFGDAFVNGLQGLHAELDGLRVTGWLGHPRLAGASAKGLHFFVGERPIRDRGILHAVVTTLADVLGPGRYPVGLLRIAVRDGAVDVNVHPQKSEVRFADPGAVAACVRLALRELLARSDWEVRAPGWQGMPLPTARAATAADATTATNLVQRWGHLGADSARAVDAQHFASVAAGNSRLAQAEPVSQRQAPAQDLAIAAAPAVALAAPRAAAPVVAAPRVVREAQHPLIALEPMRQVPTFVGRLDEDMPVFLRGDHLVLIDEPSALTAVATWCFEARQWPRGDGQRSFLVPIATRPLISTSPSVHLAETIALLASWDVTVKVESDTLVVTALPPLLAPIAPELLAVVAGAHAPTRQSLLAELARLASTVLANLPADQRVDLWSVWLRNVNSLPPGTWMISRATLEPQ